MQKIHKLFVPKYMSPARHLKSKKRILTDALQNCEKSA